MWDAIEDDNVDVRKDQMSLAAIYGGISEETFSLLAKKETTKTAWETLKMMHLGTDRVKEVRVQTLKSKFKGMRMKETESIDNFAMRLTTIANQIQALGDKMEESYVVRKFVRTVPGKFLQIVSTIEAAVKVMTVEDVIGRLKTHKERI